MKISIIGTGYVGLVSGVCFSEIGHDVSCVDIDTEKISQLSNGQCPIYEPGLSDMLRSNLDQGKLTFSNDLQKSMESAKVIYIAVGTPEKENGEADLHYVYAVAKEIGYFIREGQIVAIKSTVPVGTGKQVKAIIQEESGLNSIQVASNPEFLREGSAIYDMFHMDRVVFGVESEGAYRTLSELHQPFQTSEVVTNIESAEMIKYASNAFLAMKISFINEVANLCEVVGANVTKVAEGMGYDHRIGSAFLHAGVGYGGSCFPKDVKAMITIGEKAGYSLKILPEVDRVNMNQRTRMFYKIKQAFGDQSLKGKRIALLGLSFKPNTDDIRSAPSLDLIRLLKDDEADIICYDPIANNQMIKHIKNLTTVSSYMEALTNADALVLLTEWQEFKEINFKEVKRIMRCPVVIDGRNIFDPKVMEKLGFHYNSFGRRVVQRKGT
ncbi:UDP-glucose/GDP-mannose dehydrogenase family protein [Alkalihalophilus sp. As8PL]|uniref:UDP-glucose 6-dehydrogenase n=1 Tax=Alkalihalophilus sp. As8PL TaxID=3237103 RepID=A0AB39BPM8_9BACI